MTTTARTVVIHNPGGPEAMVIEDRPVGDPGPGEVRIRHHAVGLNYIDVYHRAGVYPLPLPAALGMEAAGVIEAVGEGVTHLKAGDHAAYAGNPPGAYTEARVMPAFQVCPLPAAISFDEGAAMMLKGMTVQFLFRRTVPIAKGDWVLFHAAAGGVGQIACQWARSEGINLIATAGSDDKCATALELGATHAINYRTTPDFATTVREMTGGRGVDVVMDSVGKDTFAGSLNALRPLGMMISYGGSSGKVPPFDIAMLAKGSLKLTRPTLFTHIADHATCQAMASDLFGKVTAGEVKINIGQRFPLDQVADAHRALEARATTASTILTI